MEGSVKELVAYRLERAEEMLKADVVKQLSEARKFVNAIQTFIKQ